MLRILSWVLLVTKHLMSRWLHCISVTWHTKIHLLHLLSHVRLLALMNLLWRLSIIASFRAIVGRLAVYDLVRNLHFLFSFAEFKFWVLHLRMVTLPKLHLKLVIVLSMIWLLIQCLLFIVFCHSWKNRVRMKLRQKIMRRGKSMFDFEKLLAVSIVTFLLILVEIIVMEGIFMEYWFCLSLTLIRKRFKFSLRRRTICSAKTIFIWNILFFENNFFFFLDNALIFQNILRFCTSISA